MLRPVIKKFSLHRRRTGVYAVLLLGLVTCIGICALGESLTVRQSVTTRRLEQYDGQVSRSSTESVPVLTGNSNGDGVKTSTDSSTGVIKVRDLFGQSASSLSKTQVSFATTHSSGTAMADLNVSMSSTRPTITNSGSNTVMRSAASVKNLDVILVDKKTSAKNLSSKVIGDGETLNIGGGVHESSFIVVKNGRSQMGTVPTYRADDTMALKLNNTAGTRSVSVMRNKIMNSVSQKTGSGSTLREVKGQEDRVVDASRTSAASSSFKYYLTNLSDTSFYDNQIKVVMETEDACADASLYDAVMTVHSAPANAQNRLAYRWLYGDQEKTHSYKIKVIFIVGLVTNRTLQRQLELENRLHNDVVQGNFLDTYHNLTYKAVFGFHWVATRCKGLRLLLRLDDDVFLATDRFFSTWSQRRANNSAKTVLCDILKNDVVRRAGKWRVPETLVAESKYTFPHCLGYFAAITPVLVRAISEVSKRTPFFWIDDVFIYGFVMSKIRGVNFMSANQGSLRKEHVQFEQCLLVNGPRACPWWLVVVDPKSFKKLYLLYYDNAAVETRSSTPSLSSQL